jgi:Tfp pilus assembly protein PilN
LEILPEISGAAGLALSIDSELNLLPAHFKEEKKGELKRISVSILSILFGFLFLISYGLLLVKSVNLKKELEIHRAHLETMKEIRLIKDEMVMLDSTINMLSVSNIQTGKIMKELSNIVPASAVLKNMAIKNIEPNVKLSGSIFIEAQLSEFMSNLERSPVFEKVNLVFSEKKKESTPGAIDFEIVCNITRRE